MATLEQRCRNLLDDLEHRLVWPDGLSKREVDVLRLIASGLSNQDIGARLFISTHTVANHIRSILAKTRTANRTEAAAYAIRRGLTPS
jgi:DNA-binding NarL/FixJ family response regulator